MNTYVLAGGCFWCLDAVFRRLNGVERSVCGYAGGEESDADYYKVASGNTRHAEAVQVTFDETILPEADLLDIFFLIHDPTTLNRQGADVGPQYRSVMFPANDVQLDTFKAAVDRAAGVWNEQIVTSLEPNKEFYEAEPEHQDYFSNNPTNPYCSVVISPKLIKARQKYAKYFTD